MDCCVCTPYAGLPKQSQPLNRNTVISYQSKHAFLLGLRLWQVTPCTLGTWWGLGALGRQAFPAGTTSNRVFKTGLLQCICHQSHAAGSTREFDAWQTLMHP